MNAVGITYRLLIVGSIVFSACASLPNGSVSTSTTTPITTTATAASTTEPSSTALGCEGAPSDFVTDGPLGIVGGADADGQQISSITLEQRGDCERFEVSVSTGGGAPATRLPIAQVELIANSGIVRIKFDASVASSAVTDSILEGSLVDRAYVVRSLDGSIFVDAHLSRAVAARTFVRQNPARVAVELQPFDAPAAEFPHVGGLVVVTGPTALSVEYPIMVTGYARTFEANVIARLFSESGTETEVFTTAAEYVQMWGEYRLEIVDGPGGDVTIFVGEDSPLDGTPQGVEFVVSAG